MGGISAGVALLRKAGIETFTIYEKSERVGGTWWDNQYPGAEVDVVSYVYSFPFKRYDWSRTHARQPEIHAYLEETCRRLRALPAPPVRRRRRARGVGRRAPRVHAHPHHRRGDRVPRADLAASGFLNVPQYPDLAGPRHASRARASTPRGGSTSTTCTARRVAIVGTGSTASQIVPDDPADRRQAARVPARARLGAPEGRPRLHRRGAPRAQQPGRVPVRPGPVVLGRRRSGC